MERWTGKTAVVTGASAGIGAAVALALANAGLVVIGVARRAHLVEDLKGKVTGAGAIHARQCDVSSPEQVAQLFDWVDRVRGGADVLVNNAAVIYHGGITDAAPHAVQEHQLLEQLDVNIKSVVLCARRAANSLVRRAVPGHIVNINSVIGHYISGSNIFNTYCASKHAVTAFTKTLREEFSSFKVNIKVTSVSPGLVNTQMVTGCRVPGTAEIISQVTMLQPQDIADAILYLLSTPPHVNIDELTITPIDEKKL